MADELERPEETSETHEHEDPGAHLPPPTIWPFAFAGAVALILVGLIVSMWAAVVVIVNFVVDVLYAFVDPRIKVHDL